MKTLFSALVALTVLAGSLGSAQAATFGSLEYWIERNTHQN